MKTPAPPPTPLVPIAEATALFARLCSLGGLASLFAVAGYQCCWTRLVTTYAMVLGHLCGTPSLCAVLALLSSGAGDGLAVRGSRLLSSRLAGSVSTAALCAARMRLPLPWLRSVVGEAALQSRQLVQHWQWLGYSVQILDGTMLRMRPEPEITPTFPPNHNNAGTDYWCTMRVLVCMCMGTGLILSVVTGSIHDSEQAQFLRLICGGAAAGAQCHWGNSVAGRILWMGDANFGVWSVVAAAHQRGQYVLVRLSPQRAAKFAKIAGCSLHAGLDQAVNWAPSTQDQDYRLVARTAVPGRLIVHNLEREGFRSKIIMLFTTLQDVQAADTAKLVDLYHRRWRIELSLRHFKSNMNLELLRSKSAEMAERELLTGVMAYNLVRAAMLLSAAKSGQAVWTLSFTVARRQLAAMLSRGFASQGTSTHQATWLQSWEQLLKRIAKGLLPKRRSPRPSEPRCKRYHTETFPKLRGPRDEARKRHAEEVMAKN